MSTRTTARMRARRTGGTRQWLVAVLVVGLAGCASPPSDEPAGAPADRADLNASAWARQSVVGAAPDWRHKTFGDRRPTDYLPVAQAGRAAIQARSVAGNSTLRTEVATPPGQTAGRLRFSWFVERLNDGADLRDRDIDDAVARVILTFDGDHNARFAPRDHLLSELARLITGEPLPYATLMYVWDNRYPVGTVIPNPHSERIRQLVVETGPARLGQWVDVERDVQADFRSVFGEAPGPLLSVGVMTDANNTGATVESWYGPVQLGFVSPAAVVNGRTPPDGAAPEHRASAPGGPCPVAPWPAADPANPPATGTTAPAVRCGPVHPPQAAPGS